MLYKENVGEISTLCLPETFTTRVVWSIPNLFVVSERSMGKAEQCVTSRSFSFEGRTWRLAAIENYASNSEAFLGLFISMINCNFPIPEYDINLGLETCTGSLLAKVTGKLNPYGQYGKWEFLSMSYLGYSGKDRFFSNGFLNFFCEIRQVEKIPDLLIPNEVTEESTEVPIGNIEKSDGSEAEGVDRLLQNFKKLFLDGQNSDVTLKVENREFPVYKGILSVRSPVFASMFLHDMAEKSSGVVDIPDCSAEAFEVFLLYLYTGKSDTMSPENVFNLYYAADKYSVHDLKKDCLEFMKDTLSVDTFCDVITLSLHHSESELQKVATRFFCENVKKIIKTVHWQKYLKEHTVEANELYIKAINA